MKDIKYVLITPARNEESYIEKTIRSVISQTVLPEKWVVVSDQSTDRTDEIVKAYAEKNSFISLVRVRERKITSFAAKVKAFENGYMSLKGVDYKYIGNLDADLSFEDGYYESILSRFRENPNLGIAGGHRFTVIGKKLKPEEHRPWSVCAGIQLFRRECYENIGGYVLIDRVEDTVAEIMARMKGWEVRSFPEGKVIHHRPLGAATDLILPLLFKYGASEYAIGYHPLYEIGKFFLRIRNEKPYFLGGAARLSGYFWASLRRSKKVLPHEVISYVRREQLKRMRLFNLSSIN